MLANMENYTPSEWLLTHSWLLLNPLMQLKLMFSHEEAFLMTKLLFLLLKQNFLQVFGLRVIKNSLSDWKSLSPKAKDILMHEELDHIFQFIGFERWLRNGYHMEHCMIISCIDNFWLHIILWKWYNSSGQKRAYWIFHFRVYCACAHETFFGLNAS